MGGDGGVIASNRKYMRGAGTADHTADSSRSRGEKQVSDRADALERITTCALTKAPLQFGKQAIVVCPYGRLYHKEAAVEALLRRKQHQADSSGNDSSGDELGAHIRGLKDLYEARFSLVEKNAKGGSAIQLPSCPVTGQEFNGQQPVFLLTPGNPEMTNVLSQRAFKEMGKEALQTEYGPFKDKVRLAPPASEMEAIMEAVEAKRAAKSSKSKKEKKRKERDNNKNDKLAVTTTTSSFKHSSKKLKSSTKTGAADVARGRVEDAVKSNNVLSSLFTTNDKTLSQKERNDTLFSRMG